MSVKALLYLSALQTSMLANALPSHCFLVTIAFAAAYTIHSTAVWGHILCTLLSFTICMPLAVLWNSALPAFVASLSTHALLSDISSIYVSNLASSTKLNWSLASEHHIK